MMNRIIGQVESDPAYCELIDASHTAAQQGAAIADAVCRAMRRLALVWGIHSVHIDDLADAAQLSEVASEVARREGFAQAGQTIVAIAGMPFGTPGTTNLMRIATASAALIRAHPELTGTPGQSHGRTIASATTRWS